MDQKLKLALETGVSLDTRTMYLFGEIDDDIAYKTIIGLELLNQTEAPIRVLVASPGGLESSGYAIYDAFMASRNIIEMVGMGTVGSIASAIYQAGDIRKMMPNCDYLIHDGHIGVGEISQTEIIHVAEQIKKNNNKYYEILANGSKLTLEDIQAACKKETVYSASECLEYGFCDEIVQIKVRFSPQKKKKGRRKKNNE